MENYIFEEPIKYFCKENDEVLLFHVINVGQGLMILIIFPDKTSMLFDCYITNETEKDIIQYLSKHIPLRLDENGEEKQWIDIFVNSHRDKDHYTGLKAINSSFPIKSIWDSGQYGTGAKGDSNDYKYYMYLKREIKKKYGDDSVPKLEPSVNPFKLVGNVNVYCLNSKEDFEGNEKTDESSVFTFNESICFDSNSDIIEEQESMLLEKAFLKDQHTNCLVLLIDYNGKRLLLTGDSDWHSWKEYIVPNFSDNNLLKSDILVASHHGSRSFFTDERNKDIDIYKNPNSTYLDHMDLISPSITLISCGEYSTYHHPNEEAMKIYKDKTSNGQVYHTNEKKSTFTGFIKGDGYWSVSTSDFKNYRSYYGIDFNLECEATVNNETFTITSSSKLSKGAKLKFRASGIVGIADNLVKEDVNVTWEVSNSGRNDDQDHQEIYYIGKDKKKCYYSAEEDRSLEYEGIHLLRCTIENKGRNIKITKVFYVEA